jgi:hypothetical protein
LDPVASGMLATKRTEIPHAASALMPDCVFLSDEKDKPRIVECGGALQITRKNALGIAGLAVIALFWVAINGILGGAFVAVLIVLVILVLNNAQRRKRSARKTGREETNEAR